MNPSNDRHRIGRLEMLCSAAALFLTIESMVGPWTFNPLIALVLLAVVYGVLRDLRAISAAKTPLTAHGRSLLHDRASRNAHAGRIDRPSR